MDSLGIILLITGTLVIGMVMLSGHVASRRRQRSFGSEETTVPVKLTSVNDAVLIAQIGGRITYANDIARQWFNLENSEPDLWLLSQRVHNPEALLELFAAEGQASFFIGEREINAASHRVAIGDSAQFVVIMREKAPLPSLEKDDRGSGRALEVISEIGREINASLDLDATLSTALHSVSRLVKYDSAQVCLWNQELEILRPVARVGPQPYVDAAANSEEYYTIEDGYTGRLAHTRQPLLITDVSTFTEAAPTNRPTDPLYNSFLGAVLNYQNRLIGTIELTSIEPGFFEREDMALLSLLADQIAIAIENARQYGAQAERVAELAGLQKIAQAISALQDPYKLYAQLGQRVAELMETDMAGVLLYDPEQERLAAQRPFYGVPDPVTADYIIPLEKGSPVRSLWEDVNYWFSNEVADHHLVVALGLEMLVEMAGLTNTAMVMMTVGEERIGVLQVGNKQDGTPFTLEDIRLLKIYASQVAIVVESARLYNEEQSRVAELRGLQQIVQTMGSLTNPEELYAQLTRRIAELMKVEICGVLLHEPEEDLLVARTPFYGVKDDVASTHTIPVDKRGFSREVWQEHDFYYSNDVGLDDTIDVLEIREFARDAGLRNTIMAPLSAGGRRFGMLQVANKIGDIDFDDGDKRLVTIFAGQAAALLDNARLYQDTDTTLRKRAAELRSVSRISHELNATLELERILEVIATEALRAEGARWGNLVMIEGDADSDELKYTMYFGTEVGEEAQILERAVLRGGEVLVIDDFERVPYYPSPIPGARSALLVPIHFENRVVGIISLYGYRPRGLGPSAAEFVQALSSQATIAVTNTTRHTEQVERSELLARRATQLTQIFELGRAFRSDQSVEENLATVARAITESAGFNLAIISVLDDAEESFQLVAHNDIKEDMLFKTDRQAVDKDTVMRFFDDVYKISGSYLVPHTDSAALFEALGILRAPANNGAGGPGAWHSGDLLLIPLRSSTLDLIGVLTIDRPRDGRKPMRNIVELLEIFGNQAAVMIENSRLYQSMEERAEELGQSLDSLSKSYSELDRLSQEMIRKDLELSQANELLNLRAQRLLALHRVMESVDTSRGPEDVLRSIAASVVEEMDIDLCMIAVDHDGQSNGDLEIIAAEGRFPKGTEPLAVLTGEDPISVTHRTRSAMIHAPGKNPAKSPVSRFARMLEAQTFVTLPMHFGTDSGGVLLVGSAKPGAAFDEEDRDLFTLLASQIVVEYENARLYETVQSEAATTADERDRLQQLHLITTALQQTDQLETRLAVIARGIRSVGWNKVALLLLDKEMNVQHMAAAGYEEDEEAALRKSLPSGEIWKKRFDDPAFITMRLGSSYFLSQEADWVLQNLKAPDIKYARRDLGPDTGSEKDPGSWQPADQLYLPMYAGSQIIGLINLREPASGRRPDEASLRPLELFVQQSSSAIQNTRLYQETLALQSFTEAVVESIQQGIIVTDTAGTIESLNRHVQEEYGLAENLVGKNLFKASPVLAKMGLAEKFKQVIEQGEPVEHTNAEYPHSGEVLTVNVFMYPRYDESRTMTGTVVLLENITQRARLEADIALRGRQLAALSDATRHITSTLSVEDVVRNSLDQAEEVISYAQVSLWVRQGDDLVIAGARGYPDDQAMVDLRLSLNEDPLFAEMLKNKEAIVIGDVRQDERVTGAELRPAKSWLGAPLISGDRLTGVLVFERIEAHAYAPADAQVAAALANQVAIALENARLFEQAAERADELTSRTQRLNLLNRISSTLGRSLDQDSILQTAINELAQALDAPQGCVVLFNREEEIGRLAIQYPSNPDGSVDELTFPLRDNPIIDHIQQSNTPLAIRDAARDPMMTSLQDFIKAREIQSALIIPFLVGNSAIGFMIVTQTERGHWFEAGQLELAQTITNQAAISVQNAQLFQETVARRAELGVLFEAGRIASSSLDLDTVVNSASNYFVRALKVDGCTISLWEQSSDKLTCLLSFSHRDGASEPGETDHRYNLKDYPATYSVITERGAVVLDMENPALSENERGWMGTRNIQTMLVLPLLARDETIGLVELWSREPHRFSQRDIGLGRALATTIATAMENARLHDETQKRLGELSRINEISRALTQPISTEDLYQVLQDQIGRVLNTQSLTLAAPDQINGQITFPLAVRSGLRIHIAPIGYGADLYSYVMETREALLINRQITERVAELGVDHTESGLKSFLAVPLVSGEKVLGVLAIEDYENEGIFHEADLRVLNPIAAQVAVSMENARLYGELEQRLSETTTLQEVSRVVNSALDLDEIFERVVKELADAFQYPLIGLFALDGRELQIQAYHGYEADEIETLTNLNLETGIVGRAARSGQVEFVENVTLDPDYIPVKDWVHSLIAVPIVSDEIVLGILTVHSDEKNPLDENDVQMLRTFAGQVATAMVNASLYTEMVRLSEELEQRVEERTRELREERDRIDTLYRIAVELTASLDLDRVLNRALELVGEAVGADSGSLFLVDPQSDKLIWRALMSDSEILPPGGRQIALTRHEGLAGWVMDNRKSIVLDNVQLDPRWANVPGTEDRRSILGAPLVANEEVLGCIFFNSDTISAFNEGHLQLAEAAANQVANSINNAELYRLIRDQAERLGAMLRSQQTEAAKSQAILESVADGVMVSDQAGQIILFNAAAERILDLRREELLGRTTADLTGLYGAGAEGWTRMLEEWSADPLGYQGEFLSEQLEIGTQVVSVHVSPVVRGREYLGLVSVFRDITREVMADRIKSEFVATVSHELRTPMTSIKGYADLLLLGAAGELNQDQRRFLEIVKSNADRLSLLVNDLLDISRIEQGGVDLDLRPIDLNEVINDVLISIEGRRETEGRSLDILADIPEDLPKIEGDYDRITQIITNLVSNAYQYTPDEGVITVRARHDDDGVEIDVSDTGIGIPKGDQERLFERFFRGEHPIVMSTAGTGLGLSIVRHLIEMHHGQVSFESEEGVGTTFTVWLPLHVTDR